MIFRKCLQICVLYNKFLGSFYRGLLLNEPQLEYRKNNTNWKYWWSKRLNSWTVACVVTVILIAQLTSLLKSTKYFWGHEFWKRELRNENKNLPCLQLLSYHVLIDWRKKTIYLMNELFSFYRIHVVSGGERSNSGRKLWNPIVWPFSQVLQTVLCIRFLRFLNFSAHLGRKTKSFYGGLRWAVAKQHAGVKVTPRESVYCVRITLLLWICYLMLCRVQCFLDY